MPSVNRTKNICYVFANMNDIYFLWERIYYGIIFYRTYNGTFFCCFTFFLVQVHIFHFEQYCWNIKYTLDVKSLKVPPCYIYFIHPMCPFWFIWKCLHLIKCANQSLQCKYIMIEDAAIWKKQPFSTYNLSASLYPAFLTKKYN